MVDNLLKGKRNNIMSNIRSKDSKLELTLWCYLDHEKIISFPKFYGNQDFGSESSKIAIFVDDCFWHGCPKCYKSPSNRTEFMAMKLDRNIRHDQEVALKLWNTGFVVLRFWEHDISAVPYNCAEKAMEV